jgi:cell division protein FtsB
MQRYAALWVFPVVSLVLVVFMTIRGGQVVDAPEETPVSAATELAALLERNTNLSVILAKSVDARTELQRHVQALHTELTEMRAARTALVGEAKLWRESYDVLAARFDELAKLARTEHGAIADSGAEPMPASFEREKLPVPRPSDVIIVR